MSAVAEKGHRAVRKTDDHQPSVQGKGSRFESKAPAKVNHRYRLSAMENKSTDEIRHGREGAQLFRHLDSFHDLARKGTGIGTYLAEEVEGFGSIGVWVSHGKEEGSDGVVARQRRDRGG